MRKLYPDNQQTQEIFNRDDNKATKQDIQDLSLQIAETNQTLQNTINALSTLSDSLAQSLNTNEINAVNASINMLQAASANLASANIGNLTVEEVATLNELTANVATFAEGITAGRVNVPGGDVTAERGTFQELSVWSADIANFTIDHFTAEDFRVSNDLTVDGDTTTSDLEVTDTATIKDANITNADIDEADIDRANITEANVDLLKADEIAIENIHWKAYQVYTADSPKLFMVLPHFENGIYFLRAKDGNQNTLFTVEVHNSIDNLFARWSQKELNWVYKISKVGTGASTQCMLEVHNIDNVAFNLEYATICATPNVPAPTTYTTQPYPGNPMYKVSHQDGNKFFQNVDLANEGTTGAGLTMYATSNWELATTYYNYDGTMGVMSYNYLPNQSLNTSDNVEFYGLNVHDFSTTNLNVPGTLKAKHIYDGPTLTVTEKAALPDDTLLIEEGTTEGDIPNAYSIAKTLRPSSMSDFYINDLGATYKWAPTFERCEEGVGFEEVYPDATVDYFPDYTTTPDELKAEIAFNEEYPPSGSTKTVGSSIMVRNVGGWKISVVYFAKNDDSTSNVAGAVSTVEVVGTWIDPSIDPTTGELMTLSTDATWASRHLLYKPGASIPEDEKIVYDENGDPMPVSLFENLHVGDSFRLGDYGRFEDASEWVVIADEMHFLHTTDLTYASSSGNGTITRKTTKSGTVQIKPLVPFNDDADPTTDDSPLVYDRTSDTIKKATGDITLPGDLAVAGDETVTGDLTVEGSLNAKDVEFDGNIKAEDLILTGDLEVENDAMFRKDVSISGDLYVDGVEHINDSETTQSSGDYMILRHNNPIPLGSGEKSGIAVHNYKTGGTATISVDHEGTWRLADNTATSTMHTNLYYYDGKYYDTSFVEQTFVDQIKTAFDEDEIGDCVFYNSDSFYHFDGTHWYAVTLVNNKLITDETEVTDAALITALNALTKGPLQYFRKLEITTINEIENEAIFTRDEEANMADKALVQWDAATSKAKTIPLPTMNNQALTAQVQSAEPGFDEHLVQLGDLYFESFPSVPFTGTIPADASRTEEPIGGDAGYFYSATENKYYVRPGISDNFEIISITYDGTVWEINQSSTAVTLPADAVAIDVTAGHYYKAAVPASTTYQWKSNVGGGGLSFVGTRAQYNAAKLIPEGQDGYIGPNTLVTITDEDDFVTGDER